MLHDWKQIIFLLSSPSTHRRPGKGACLRDWPGRNFDAKIILCLCSDIAAVCIFAKTRIVFPVDVISCITIVIYHSSLWLDFYFLPYSSLKWITFFGLLFQIIHQFKFLHFLSQISSSFFHLSILTNLNSSLFSVSFVSFCKLNTIINFFSLNSSSFSCNSSFFLLVVLFYPLYVHLLPLAAKVLSTVLWQWRYHLSFLSLECMVPVLHLHPFLDWVNIELESILHYLMGIISIFQSREMRSCSKEWFTISIPSHAHIQIQLALEWRWDRVPVSVSFCHLFQISTLIPYLPRYDILCYLANAYHMIWLKPPFFIQKWVLSPYMDILDSALLSKASYHYVLRDYRGRH